MHALSMLLQLGFDVTRETSSRMVMGQYCSQADRYGRATSNVLSNLIVFHINGISVQRVERLGRLNFSAAGNLVAKNLVTLST